MARFDQVSFTRFISPATRSSAWSHSISTNGSWPRRSGLAPGPFSSQLLRTAGRRTRRRATSSDSM